MRTTSRAGFALLLASLVACAQLGPPPVIEVRGTVPDAGQLARLAVLPWQTPPGLTTGADLLARYTGEALSSRDVPFVAASDVELALETQGLLAQPEQLPQIAALVAHDFGASGLLLLRVRRFREREGEALGASRPASVGFELTLWDVRGPTPQRVWTGVFDQTQHSLSEGVLAAQRYPGGGSRWLTAEELGGWGARQAVESLLSRTGAAR